MTGNKQKGRLLKMRDMRLLVVASVIMVISVGSVCLVPAGSDIELRLTGSKYMYYVVTDMATVYMQDHRNVKVMATPSEPYTYLQSLMDKSADGIMTLSKLDEDIKAEAEEQGINLAERIIGWGSLAFITHPSNPVTELTIEQVRKIFQGEYRNWSELGGFDEPIVPISRDESVSGISQFLRDTVLDGAPLAQETVRELSHDIIRAVWAKKGALADARYTEAVRGKLKGMAKIVAIKKDEQSEGVLPSLETTRNQTYPLCFPLIMYYDARTTKPELDQFAKFCAHRGLGPHFADSWTQK